MKTAIRQNIDFGLNQISFFYVGVCIKRSLIIFHEEISRFYLDKDHIVLI